MSLCQPQQPSPFLLTNPAQLHVHHGAEAIAAGFESANFKENKAISFRMRKHGVSTPVLQQTFEEMRMCKVLCHEGNGLAHRWFDRA